jgi:hypothetical protein
MQRMRTGLWLLLVLLLWIPPSLQAQQQAVPTNTPQTGVPRLIKFAGSAADAGGKALDRTVGITFAIYKDQQGGAPVWMETQNVELDGSGHYTALLGTTTPDGLPMDLFTSGEARWVGVQVQEEGQPEQARVLLLSVPYALKAADAETVGGLPASAFVLGAPPTSTSMAGTTSQGATVQPLVPGTKPVTTAGGAPNMVSKFDATADITNSQIFDNATNVGIGNTAPAAKLDVSGTGIFRGLLSLPATGSAIAMAGKNSQPFNFTASSFNSGTAAAVNQVFGWQAEAAGNNTTTPSGTLNLLYGSGTAVPTETGLRINNKGVITFASAQTFPATVGTVKSVGLSAPASDFTVSGSPVTGSGTLGLNWKVAPTNANTANAIVKRDGTGSFNVTNINGSGTFATTTANATAILGSTSRDGGFGVHGSATAAGGTHASLGVVGDSVSTVFFSSGVIGIDGNTTGTGGVTLGVQGHSVNPVGIGVLGFNGFSGPSNQFLSHSGFQRIGVWGDAEGSGSAEGIGVIGTSDTGIGVVAQNNTGSSNPALLAAGGSGLSGGANNGAPGISSTGGNNGCCISGSNSAGAGGPGIMATGGAGSGISTTANSPGDGGAFSGGTYLTGTLCSGHCGGEGIFATGGFDNNHMNQGFAGDFIGDIIVSGAIRAGTKDFQVDHPLDPANKYLVHASVESSEMMNIYSAP